MKKRIRNKIFKRAQLKFMTDKTLTPLEDKVWKEVNGFFIKVIAPIINEITNKETVKERK
ncbi:hypothetical protein KAU33_16190 [Candidatus Dependentiae bacterium]|nr:hypothetical protein [Candidatus Dependentiae bacterium]